MGEDEESIIAVLNSRFLELRTLMITIGSILAMLMAGLNQAGIVDFLDFREDIEPTPEGCDSDWEFVVDYYVIEYDLLLNMRVSDTHLCNEVHTVEYYVAMNDYEYVNQSGEFRNTHIFSHTIESIEEGTHHVLIEVMNGSISLFESLVLDFEFDEGEHESAVYGCTDPVATNYNETATHDDGSCEYEQEEEEITDDCIAKFYDVQSYWANNNTSLYNEFDVDFSCQANVTITVVVEVFAYDNESDTKEIIRNSNLTYNTYHYDWDYHFIDFYNLSAPEDTDLEVLFRVYHQDEEDDMTTVWV